MAEITIHDPPRLYARGLVLPGRRDVFQANNHRPKICQDHAVGLQRGDLGVVAVADGVSLVGQPPEPSHAQGGAVLLAELAAAAALKAAGRCDSPEAVGETVGRELAGLLLPLAETLGSRAHMALASTLVLGVTTPSWVALWLVGDGCWGVGGPRPGGGRWCVVGGEHHRLLPSCMPFALAKGRMPPPVYTRTGDVDHVFVATDGLEAEPGIAAALRRGPALLHRLSDLAVRPQGCDDLAFALVSPYPLPLLPPGEPSLEVVGGGHQTGGASC